VGFVLMLAINQQEGGNMEVAEIISVVALGVAWIAAQFIKKK